MRGGKGRPHLSTEISREEAEQHGMRAWFMQKTQRQISQKRRHIRQRIHNGEIDMDEAENLGWV